ncbi:MAG TPA: CatB-related O-acetyltransferase [Verrucomicrobiota bacterium]|nr:MAG: Virginiamycin A acetyltransferase [Verrucomicrobia bacterium ADurb.Bin006]HOR70698.1 CatB-related O-acetyltransferase [Verrucomicrobiota bacterium]HQF58595.1 CatB-related O-acetyltransferase [Verrucomicrobiota bacterium]HQJ99965.1 CatB-related O-acetyltransferase [Verrucomicrobiota bacterium]
MRYGMPRAHRFGGFLFAFYACPSNKIRACIRRAVNLLEGGELHSVTLRRIFAHYHAVVIGQYTHGGCFTPGAMDKFTSIGRYSSIAHGVRVMNRNHPLERKSTHAAFFNPQLGYCRKDTINYVPLDIGNDVWVGFNALILPHTSWIGDGSVIAAGSVVNKSVPPYAVVAGNPARVVRYRFPPVIIDQLLASRWWERSIEELELDQFTRPLIDEHDPGAEC